MNGFVSTGERVASVCVGRGVNGGSKVSVVGRAVGEVWLFPQLCKHLPSKYLTIMPRPLDIALLKYSRGTVGKIPSALCSWVLLLQFMSWPL